MSTAKRPHVAAFRTVRSFIALPLIFFLFGCQTDTGLRNIEVTPENQEEIQKNIQSSRDLTVEEVRLLDAYLERQELKTGSAALPTGRTIAQLIEDERAFRGESPATTDPELGEPAETDDSASDGIPVAKDSIFADDKLDPKSGSAASKEPPPPPPPSTAALPSGTQIQARLEQPLSSKRNEAGERVEMSLEEDLIVDGQLLAPAGSRVVGRLTDVKKSGRVKGRARMSISLYQIHVEDEQYRIRSSTLAFEAQGTKKEDAKKVGIGAGIGAVVGAIAGGGKGAAIGGVIGAGAGSGAVLATSGDEVEFKIEQLFSFITRSDIEMKILR